MTRDIDLYLRLRELVAIADRAGAPADWLDETSHLVVVTLRELAELRQGARDPRRARTLAEAKRLAAMLDVYRRAGYGEAEARAEARERLGLRKAAFYRLLGWSREVPRLFPAIFTASSRKKAAS